MCNYPHPTHTYVYIYLRFAVNVETDLCFLVFTNKGNIQSNNDNDNNRTRKNTEKEGRVLFVAGVNGPCGSSLRNTYYSANRHAYLISPSLHSSFVFGTFLSHSSYAYAYAVYRRQRRRRWYIHVSYLISHMHFDWHNGFACMGLKGQCTLVCIYRDLFQTLDSRYFISM